MNCYSAKTFQYFLRIFKKNIALSAKCFSEISYIVFSALMPTVFFQNSDNIRVYSAYLQKSDLLS